MVLWDLYCLMAHICLLYTHICMENILYYTRSQLPIFRNDFPIRKYQKLNTTLALLSTMTSLFCVDCIKLINILLARWTYQKYTTEMMIEIEKQFELGNPYCTLCCWWYWCCVAVLLVCSGDKCWHIHECLLNVMFSNGNLLHSFEFDIIGDRTLAIR